MSMDLMTGSLGGAFDPNELAASPNGGAGITAARSGSSSPESFPDRTVFIVIVSLLATISLLLIAALVALAMYSRRNSQKYFVSD